MSGITVPQNAFSRGLYNIVGNCSKNQFLVEYKEAKGSSRASRQGVPAQFHYFRDIGSEHKAGGFNAGNMHGMKQRNL